MQGIAFLTLRAAASPPSKMLPIRSHFSEFMKTLLQRFTRWHNGRTKRKGNLWEENFKSVVVEDGEAARTMAAYIDLNHVRLLIPRNVLPRPGH